ncbi:MAG: 3-isopropylmalate dehydratase small subunit [archaeon]|nr:3-isopropylmalate dehydratase small subunit [archaeon]
MSTAQSKITQVAAKGIAVRGNDIDTDRIIPARFMRTITFDGLGKYAFHDVRFDEKGKQKEHPFNKKEHEGAGILIVNKNFGCGSSREHAPQSLMRWGIKAIVGESFAEIFAGNCQMLGVPCTVASEAEVLELQDFVEKEPSAVLTLNISEGKIEFGDMAIDVKAPEGRKKSLVEGTWDTMGLLINNLEETRKKASQLPYMHNFGK